MNTAEAIAAILGSSVVSSFLTSWFVKASSDKSVRIENITGERKEWRDRLRELVVVTATAFHEKKCLPLKEIEAELIVRLNPEDNKDIEILECFKKLYVDWKTDDLEEFNDRVSCLLKHDWERVKQECSTEIPSQNLAWAAAFATFWLVLIGNKLSMPYNFLYVGICVMLFFITHAVSVFLIRKLCEIKQISLKEVYCFVINSIPRKCYEDRESRKKRLT